MKNIQKLQDTLVKIAQDNEAYDALIEKMESAVYSAVNNYVGDYDCDMDLIKSSLSNEEFNLIKRLNFNTTERSFEEYEIDDELLNDYIKLVVEGDIKSNTIDVEAYWS